MKYKQNWDLDVIFPGGYNSKQAQQKLEDITKQINELQDKLNNFENDDNELNFAILVNILKKRDKINDGIKELSVFWTAHQSDDFNNREITPKLNKVNELYSKFGNCEITLAYIFKKLSDDNFERFLKLPETKEIAFNLKELRKDANELLDKNTEKAINQLSIDGLTGWSNHYDTIASNISVTYSINDNSKTLSAGQALNQLTGASNNEERKNIMSAYEKAWSEHEDELADTLNYLAGFRLQNYQLHGTNDFLKKPLELNRMKQKTLMNMWNVIEANKDIFIPYMDRKAQLLHKEHFDWQDQDAPITFNNQEKISYDDAASFILENFEKFSPKMANLAKKAFENGWLEVENRPGKQPGGYMEEVPEIKQSRIFLTYTGTPEDASSVAHELGHAFHYEVVKDLPSMRRDYAMNVAETASTFAELIVSDANVKNANSIEEKVSLLDAKLMNPLAMCMNIRARYLFETNFYKERMNGYVPAKKLNELMLAAQKWAFNNHLGTYHPHFWASKLHFYIDDVPFYNFPYTFGYLFSLGIYAKAQEQPDTSFEDQYIALLRDTANMTTEDLVKKHLNVDLSIPDFWQKSIQLIKQDIDQFIKLSDNLI